MDPKYSVLLCNKTLVEYEDKIKNWLSPGIKVLWFGKAEEVSLLKERHADFARAFLLQAYVTSLEEQGMLIDGEGSKALFDKIAEDCTLFNSAQYSVEHCKADEHIVVQASAGTGKTTVMIDRIMYLLHMYPELQLAEVFMITFTNDAAQQMSNRIQDAFMTRYSLTKQKKYMCWVEEQSQMHVS